MPTPSPDILRSPPAARPHDLAQMTPRRIAAYEQWRAARFFPGLLYVVVMVALGVGAGHRAAFAHALPWYLSPFPEVPFFSRTHIVFSLASSLGIEEKFYLLWPLLAFVLLRRRARGRLGLALVLALALQLPIAFATSGRALAPYSAILIGCVLAFVMHERRTFGAVARLGSRAGLLCATGLLVTVHALTHLFGFTAPGFRVASPYYYLPYSVATALVVASLALRAGGSGALESAPLRFVGRVSYPLYLIHPIARGFAAAAIAPGGALREALCLAGGLALSLAFAYALHRLVEKPLIRIGRRTAEHVSPKRPIGAPAPALTPLPG